MNILKGIIPYRFKRKVKEDLGVPSLHWSLQNLKNNNFDPKFVLDIGAYEGNWTKDLLEVFPSAKVLMVEAQLSKEVFLRDIHTKHSNTSYEITLLSSQDGVEKYFVEDETASTVKEVQGEGVEYVKKISRSLDTLLEEKKYPFPDFIKLDVQGHELEVLKGAQNAMKNAEVCLMEVSLLNLGENDPLLFEVLSFMDKINFQPYDISQFMRRPFDKALFQMDMFFVKKDSALVASKRWS